MCRLSPRNDHVRQSHRPTRPAAHPRPHRLRPGLQPQEPGWIKLNTNENAYPPSPRVVEALRREIGTDGASLRLYPNPTSAPLRAAVAKRHGLDPHNVCIGNGGDDILNLLVRVFCGPEVAARGPSPATRSTPSSSASKAHPCRKSRSPASCACPSTPSCAPTPQSCF
jgi:histidinol-phosphate/aromatic aminotransferase/cobyric acid decarboxylase-like protein